MPVSRSSGPLSGGNDCSSPCVYGCCGSAPSFCGGRALDDLARVHDRDPVGELEQQRDVVRDEEDGEPEVPLQRLDLLHDLSLHDDVERRGRLVEHDQLRVERERDRDDHALPHPARELVRVRAYPAAVDADELEQLLGLRERTRLVDALVRAHCVDELVADAHHRVERVHRALEHHRDVPPAEPAHVLVALADEVLAAEDDAAAGDPARRPQDLHHGVRDGGLAAARLAGEPEDLALVDVEVDAVDGAGAPVVDRQPAQLEQRGRVRSRSRPALPSEPSC